VRIPVEVIDASGVEQGRPPADAMHLITFGDQEFGQVRPVLPGDSGDDCFLSQNDSPRKSVARGRDK
jgi:hypothetical protein